MEVEIEDGPFLVVTSWFQMSQGFLVSLGFEWYASCYILMLVRGRHAPRIKTAARGCHPLTAVEGPNNFR